MCRRATTTGKEQKIVIQASSGLSESEIERMVVKDAEQCSRTTTAASAKRSTRATQPIRCVYQTEKNLKENKDRVPRRRHAS